MIKGRNYRHNCKCCGLPEKGEMINGQALGAVSQLRYGLCRMSFNGCEVISVYNALTYLGKAAPLPEIALYMERFRMLMGVFGCYAGRIGRALEKFGAEYVRADKYRGEKAFIVSYWTGRPFLSSIHTVFCVREEGGIRVYNRYNNRGEAQLCAGFETFAGKRKPIALYTIITDTDK
ncbi:hypothetical protein [uncultured Ruminococcus sp.]|uniref:hypothetical protein n=1 Tax=uncultured Ruminococcus sp. TaxID=165186 RepID=UPI002636C01F|nr:hypothetical protein [uncultured Ruminococcus sp.]